MLDIKLIDILINLRMFIIAPIFSFVGMNESEARKWSKLKRSLRLTGLAKSVRKQITDKPQDAEEISDREGGLPSIFLQKKAHSKGKSGSPKIATKTPRMVVTESDANRNYSEI